MLALAAPSHELQGESNCILNVAPSDYRDYRYSVQVQGCDRS